MSPLVLADSEAAALCRAIRLRREPGGRTIAFSLNEHRYTFVNHSGVRTIELLREGKTVAEVSEHLARETGSPLDRAHHRLVALLLTVSGRAPATAKPAASEHLPAAWTLVDELGDEFDRCETFSMPL